MQADGDLEQVRQSRKCAKAEQQALKQKAKGEQQVLREQLKSAKLQAKLLREQEQNLLAKQRAEAVAQRKQDAAERQALKQQEKEKHATSKADQIVMPAPGGSIPEE